MGEEVDYIADNSLNMVSISSFVSLSSAFEFSQPSARRRKIRRNRGASAEKNEKRKTKTQNDGMQRDMAWQHGSAMPHWQSTDRSLVTLDLRRRAHVLLVSSQYSIAACLNKLVKRGGGGPFNWLWCLISICRCLTTGLIKTIAWIPSYPFRYSQKKNTNKNILVERLTLELH